LVVDLTNWQRLAISGQVLECLDCFGRTLCFPNELGGIAADSLTVEDVKHSQLLNGFLAEAAQGDVDQDLAESLGESSPGGTWR
jgi:hypothetical protein